MNFNVKSLTEAEQRQLLSDSERLMGAFKTALMATQGGQGAEISYAPYSRSQQGDFYVFISGLASHTANLKQHGACQLMFIADESASRNLFARERLSWQCQAQQLGPADPDYERQLEQMQQELGETLAVLRSLPDFCLFRLRPTSGRYVVGFGRAYQLDPASGRVEPVTG